jgi:hypothetical protein
LVFPLTSDSASLPNNPGHTDHHDITNLVGEYRQRQLNLFRERQPELEPDEQISAHLPTH